MSLRDLVLRIVVGSWMSVVPLAAIAAPQEVQNGGDFSANPNPDKVPEGVLIVKGAWSSASDSTTPLPEGGTISRHAYHSGYFGLTYPLGENWAESYQGPPPSDSGYYVLAQIHAIEGSNSHSRGSVLIAAQDLFFTPTSAQNTPQLISFVRDHLTTDYVLEQSPTEIRIAGHAFVRMGYGSPVTGLHWTVLATELRCHTIQFVFTSADVGLIDSLVDGMSRVTLPSEKSTSTAPVCVKDYATTANIVRKVPPLFSGRRFNPVPVRVIIDADGKVRHIHFISAFPDQAKAITDALMQWRFKPYLRDGHPVAVETGIMFGHVPQSVN